MQPRSLFRRFRLKLITSSHACERGAAEVPRTANQIFGESDAMAVSTNTAEVRLSRLLVLSFSARLRFAAHTAHGDVCNLNIRSRS